MTVSIVTTVYNDRQSLKRIMDSVLSQTYPNIEHCIADGGSEDGSTELLKQYEEKYKKAGKTLKWISKKDKGIYDGMNNACALATGDYMLWCTDLLYDRNVISLMAGVINERHCDYLYGGIIFRKNGIVTRRWSGRPGNWRFGWMAANSTLCYRRGLYEKYGPYDISYKSAADYKFQVKIFQDTSLTSAALVRPLVIFDAGGASNGGVKANLISIAEDFRIMSECGVRFGWFTVVCKMVIAFFAYAFAPRKRFVSKEERGR